MLRSYGQPSQYYGHTDEDEGACETDASSSRRRPPPQFFVNSSGVSPALQPSLHRDYTGVSLSSLPSSPSQSRRTSRASLAALRVALQRYQISPEDETRPIFASDSDRPVSLTPDDRMDALVDIHRVLYRGKEDLEGKELSWNEQGQEVRRVVERWFEADCSYDHPLVRISSRQACLTHFALLHLMSTCYLPSLTPSAILYHVTSLTSRIRSRLLGDGEAEADVEAVPSKLDKKGKMQAVENAWSEIVEKEKDEVALRQARWWRLWDVSANCKEIGNIDCDDGYHLAMIEHVVSLSLFPALVNREVERAHFLKSAASSSTMSFRSDDPAVPLSFSSRLVAVIADEFNYLLHWDLPISTVVHFNETGKATHIRDVLDIRDVVETFVPFAKRLGWITRRLTGLVSSTMGSIAMSMVPSPTATSRTKVKPIVHVKATAAPVGLGLEMPSTPSSDPFSRKRSNTLGLEGVGSFSAPDCTAVI